jgi:hypothetical protein
LSASARSALNLGFVPGQDGSRYALRRTGCPRFVVNCEFNQSFLQSVIEKGITD